jgi:hypothetical protein
MANLTPEQESVNNFHIRHQANHISRHDDCKECERIVVKTKLDQDKAFEDYMLKQRIRRMS